MPCRRRIGQSHGKVAGIGIGDTKMIKHLLLGYDRINISFPGFTITGKSLHGLFGNCYRGCLSDDGCVIGAGDGNSRRCRIRASMAIVNGIGNCNLLALAFAEVIKIRARIKGKASVIVDAN